MEQRDGGKHCAHCQKYASGYVRKFPNSQLSKEIRFPYQPQSRLYRIAVALALLFSCLQMQDVQARWRTPLAMENRFWEAPWEQEKPGGDSLVLKGKVTDETNQGVIAAIVEVSRDGIILGGAATDEEGLFTIRLKQSADSFKVDVMSTGYKRVVSTLSASELDKFHEIKMDQFSNEYCEFKEKERRNFIFRFFRKSKVVK
jgi:hypothetical protein